MRRVVNCVKCRGIPEGYQHSNIYCALFWLALTPDGCVAAQEALAAVGVQQPGVVALTTARLARARIRTPEDLRLWLLTNT